MRHRVPLHSAAPGSGGCLSRAARRHRFGRVTLGGSAIRFSFTAAFLVLMMGRCSCSNTDLVVHLTTSVEAESNIFRVGSASSLLIWARIDSSALQSSAFCTDGCWALALHHAHVGAPRQTWASIPPAARIPRRFPAHISPYKPREQGVPIWSDNKNPYGLISIRTRTATPRELCREHLWSEATGQFVLLDAAILDSVDYPLNAGELHGRVGAVGGKLDDRSKLVYLCRAGGVFAFETDVPQRLSAEFAALGSPQTDAGRQHLYFVPVNVVLVHS